VKIDIVTLFPDFFSSPLDASILARAAKKNLLDVETHDPRQFTTDKHRSVDGVPYGGGGGMVLKPEPVFALWEAQQLQRAHCIYLTADGQKLDHDLSVELSLTEHLVLLCGHYKGVDERIRTHLIDREVSIGDFVLTGGEPAALILIDAVVRLIPGVLGNFSSALDDSFQNDLLDCPWYTRPAEFNGDSVPTVLQSGDHEKVRSWRRQQALRKTFERRPDLLQGADLDREDQKLVSQWEREGLE
jgi:tRNA (guanine37-N1)-methyltransferase